MSHHQLELDGASQPHRSAGGRTMEDPAATVQSADQDGRTESSNTMSNLLVSCISASLSHVPHHPLYTLKSQMMYKGKNFQFSQFLRSAVDTRGTFLMRGVITRSIGIAPEKALKMLAWDKTMDVMNQYYPHRSKFFHWAVAGALAGAATTIIGCPSERVMVLAQIQNKGFFAVLKSAGIHGLYHGAEATLYRDVTFNMSLFMIRAFIMKRYEDRHGEEMGALAKVWYGLPATLAAGVIACPFDVVKTRIQGNKLQGVGSESRRPLVRMLQIARNEGVRYLYKGLLPRLVAVPLYMSVFITVNEELQKAILGTRIKA